MEIRQHMLITIARQRSPVWSIFGRHRSVMHVGRKVYHITMGISCFLLYAFVLSQTQALQLLGFVGGAWVLFDCLRLKIPRLNRASMKVLGKLMRKEELNRLTACSYYVIGLFIIVLLFPRPIVLLSVLYLALGDPAAAIIGTRFGKTRLLGSKSWEGSIANFVISSFATFMILAFYLRAELSNSLWIAMIGGVISCLSEILPLPIDDNFSIPVVSSILLSTFQVVR